MSIFEHRGTRKTLRIFTKTPQQVLRHSSSEPAQLLFPNGDACTSTCIGCADEPCRLLNSQERTIEGVNAFAADTNSALCPVKAISWAPDSETPKIDSATCIGCGLCVSRCPVGAISINDNVATVSTAEIENPDSHLLTTAMAEGENKQREQIAIVPKQKFQEPILADTEVVRVASSLSETSDVVQKAAIRSILIAAGCSVSLSRKGDVHTRMDGTYATLDGARGPLEVEFGLDSLEAVRASLDDVAVLNSRYELPKDTQAPLVVCKELPRERQGYWQVVLDIDRVLGLKIRTVTLGALLLLVWNGKTLTEETLENLTPHFGSTSIREQIVTTLGRPVTIPHRLGSVLEPEK